MTSTDDAFINDVTLQYLTNKEFASRANKHLATTDPKVKSKEKRFYKKRILGLTKCLLYDTVPEDSDIDVDKLPPDISLMFSAYLKICIDYFKALDRTDILQGEYEGIAPRSPPVHDMSDTHNDCQLESDERFLKSVYVRPTNTLDNFVQKTLVKKEKKEYPRKKNINLADPLLKNKGVSKKKNIDTKYEGATETKIKNKDNHKDKHKKKDKNKDNRKNKEKGEQGQEGDKEIEM